MGKKSSKRSETTKPQNSSATVFRAVDEKAVDPGLASLFASSLGPVERPPKSRYQALVRRPAKEEDENDAELSTADEDVDMKSDSDAAESDEEQSEDDSEGSAASEESDSEQSQSENEKVLARLQESVLQVDAGREQRKRKRVKEEDLEDTYMKKLAREEAKEEEVRRKKMKKQAEEDKSDESSAEDDDISDEERKSAEADYVPPKHETEQDEIADDVEKASRTVFLGNVANSSITSKTDYKKLMKHLSSFIPDLPDHKSPHKIESFRFRSTAFVSALPKKAAFVKKELMDATTKSTNAYAVYTTQLAAREAVKRLNGSMVLNRHLRVDSVAHPMKVDNRRCVFVGNLGFVDDESSLNEGDDDNKKKKNKPPADVEEGLWVHFSKAGKVDSVRVIRDPKTRVGKGIAYVQFADENGVEAALQYNDQKFPPLLPRKLRVVRAKGMKNAGPKKNVHFKSKPHQKSVYNAKVTNEQKSMQGRAQKLLGKAGAFRTAESFVFEGHRAKPGADKPATTKKRKTMVIIIIIILPRTAHHHPANHPTAKPRRQQQRRNQKKKSAATKCTWPARTKPKTLNTNLIPRVPAVVVVPQTPAQASVARRKSIPPCTRARVMTKTMASCSRSRPRGIISPLC